MSQGTPLARIEAFLDAVPRLGARAEDVGPFTLFISEVAWPYYARPRRGAVRFTAADVDAARVALREAGQPERFEWVAETAPGLSDAIRAAGLDVLELPLMALDRSLWRAPDEPTGVTLRTLGGDEPDLAQALAVAEVGFANEGTAPGPQGRAEREAAAAGLPQGYLGDMAARLRRRATVTVVADAQLGPVAIGSHRLVDGVCEVVGVATLPSLRRQGLGGAVTGALVEDALEHGAELVFLSAGSDDVASVYARLGFRRIGTACFLA